MNSISFRYFGVANNQMFSINGWLACITYFQKNEGYQFLPNEIKIFCRQNFLAGYKSQNRPIESGSEEIFNLLKRKGLICETPRGRKLNLPGIFYLFQFSQFSQF